MRTCTGCNLEKELDEFGPNPRSKSGGRMARCKVCVNEYARAWHTSHKAQQNERSRRRYNPDKVRASSWLRTYNITADQYFEMLASQEGVCAGCGREPDEKRFLDVDHDHACCPGKKSCGRCVRGLLCRLCNTVLGLLSDDAVLLRRLAFYVEVEVAA